MLEGELLDGDKEERRRSREKHLPRVETKGDMVTYLLFIYLKHEGFLYLFFVGVLTLVLECSRNSPNLFVEFKACLVHLVVK